MSLSPKQEQLFKQASKHIPGGVNSPVRAFNGVGGTPVFIEKAKGAYLWDVDGKRYVDYVGSWGPMILGHAHPEIIKAVQTAAEDGLSFGAPTVHETTLADIICEIMPSIELVRMTNSGTEATMTAIRLARGYTGRDKIVKFEGCYHGHSDSLLVKAVYEIAYKAKSGKWLLDKDSSAVTDKERKIRWMNLIPLLGNSLSNTTYVIIMTVGWRLAKQAGIN